jgi:hypothetical protein
VLVDEWFIVSDTLKSEVDRLCVPAIKVAKWHHRLMNSTKKTNIEATNCYTRWVSRRARSLKQQFSPSGRLVLSLRVAVRPGENEKYTRARGDRKSSHPRCVYERRQIHVWRHIFKQRASALMNAAHTRARASAHIPLCGVFWLCVVCIWGHKLISHAAALSAFFKPIRSPTGNNIACMAEEEMIIMGKG